MGFFVTQAISDTVARSSLEESCNGEAWNVHCNHHIWGINTIRLHWLKSLQRGQTRDIILAVHVQSMKNKSVNSEVILTMILQIIMQIGAVKIKEGKETSSCYPCNSQFPGSFATVVCLKPRTGCCFMLVARQPFPLKDELVTRRQFDMTFSHSARGIADVRPAVGWFVCWVLFGSFGGDRDLKFGIYIGYSIHVFWRICSVPTKVVTCHPSWKGNFPQVVWWLCWVLMLQAPWLDAFGKVFFFEA